MAPWIAPLFLALLTWIPSSWAGAKDPYEALSVVRIERKPALDFSLPQVDGEAVKLSDYRGKVILLGFFKTF